jgi:hypothetical protein
MRLLLLLVLLIALAVVIVSIVRALQARRTERDPWTLRERSDGETLRLYASKAGEQPLLVEAIPFAAEDFDMRLYEARARAQERLIALNAGRQLGR